jgi:DNA-binding transcriptional regulator YiaG
LNKPKLRSVPPCRPATPRELRELAARRRFRELRVARFRTQVEAAVFLGVDDSSVERWESGASKVPGWALVALEKEAA